MKKLLFIVVVLSQFSTSSQAAKNAYHKMLLDGKLRYEVFELALRGFYKLRNKKSDSILTIIDYSLSSTRERLFVLDLEHEKVLYQTLVAHGKNSGGSYADSFSNVVDSRKSSLGYYKTAETYYGKHGYSLRLDGLEEGINDNARHRAIVMHGAWYVSDEFINQHGRLGRSWGCPALPVELNRDIINSIKEGTYLFIYADDKAYLSDSKLLL